MYYYSKISLFAVAMNVLQTCCFIRVSPHLPFSLSIAHCCDILCEYSVCFHCIGHVVDLRQVNLAYGWQTCTRVGVVLAHCDECRNKSQRFITMYMEIDFSFCKLEGLRACLVFKASRVFPTTFIVASIVNGLCTLPAWVARLRHSFVCVLRCNNNRFYYYVGIET